VPDRERRHVVRRANAGVALISAAPSVARSAISVIVRDCASCDARRADRLDEQGRSESRDRLSSQRCELRRKECALKSD
jgi:hypothetical protein